MSTDEAPPETSEVVSVLGALLAVQDEDLRRDQLLHRRARLSERSRLDDLGRQLVDLAGAATALSAEREAARRRQQEIDDAVTELERRVTALDRRLSGGEVASFRDQEAMAAELASLVTQQRHREDDELEVMEAIEQLDARLGALDERRLELADDERTTRDSLAGAESVIDAEIAEIVGRRGGDAEKVPPVLLAEYERLRARLDGVGAARIVHGACGGCHLHLSATELDQMHRLGSGEFAHCEQCGRILVP